MVFSSLPFLFLFLPVVLLVYYLAPNPLRNGVLFVFSLIFYAWGEPVYVVLMLVSTVVDYALGRVAAHRGTRRAKGAVCASVIVNLALLGTFKYSAFLIENLNALFALSLAVPKLTLPIGISFYTFQTMSYTIDVYRGDAPVQKNIVSFGAYVALFPQLVAGPIVRYATVAEQLSHRAASADRFADGVSRFVTGLGKKALLANGIGTVWAQVSALPGAEMSVLTAWLGLFAFAFQIYFDFSGYSDMAIGLGKFFGFTFPENFNYPYLAKSVTEFWRRWHISLGAWFRSYVYIPLGGNRVTPARHLRNLLVVWLLTGFWHGASWNFVLWGVYYGALLILEKYVLKERLSRAPAAVAHGYTLFFVLMGWVLFAFDKLGDGLSYFGYLFGGAPLWDARGLYLLVGNLPLFCVLAIAATPLPRRVCRRARPLLANARIVFVFLLSVAYLVDGTYNPFLYFRF